MCGATLDSAVASNQSAPGGGPSFGIRSLVPAVLGRDRKREYGNTLLAQIFSLGAGGDTANVAMRDFMVMDLARFLDEALAYVLGVRKDVIDNARNPRVCQFAGLDGVRLNSGDRFSLLPYFCGRKLFYMRPAAHRALEQAAGPLHGKIIGRGKPPLEAMLVPAD